MTRPMLTRKRPRSADNEEELHSKKCLKTLVDRYQTDEATNTLTLKSGCGHQNGGAEHLAEIKSFCEQISSWADTQESVKRVLENLTLPQKTSDILLNGSVDDKFLEFHRDITEECGAEDKQHSWAVIEKEEEVIMYGPYYPNYNSGLHSEDVIIKQTEELLQSRDVSEDWKVYVFTMNSPCLARSTEPCMLKLVQRAQRWWSQYGVKTHVGFVKCWGFKGVKENLFRDLTFSQVDCVDRADNHESYIEAAVNTDLKPLCESLFWAVKRLLKTARGAFLNPIQEQDWKTYFKSMHSIDDCTTEEMENLLKQEVNSIIDTAKALFSGRSGTFMDHLEKGRAFASEYIFISHLADALQHQVHITFQECYSEMLQDKYAELIRDKLTEEFHQCTVQLFIRDVEKFTKEFLQIGRIQFPEDARNVSNDRKVTPSHNSAI